jgi:serine/threonine protein kinase
MKTSNPQDEYQLQLPALGSGSFGIAYKAIGISDRKVFCIKQSHKIKTLKEENDYKREFTVLQNLNHKNIIRCFEAFLYENYFYLILEYAEEGDLNELAGKVDNEAELLEISFQIIEGIRNLHANHIIHRDIKPENIFKYKDGFIKIGDFGMARTISTTLVAKTTIAGTPAFMAPEIINGEEKEIGKPADIWSVGVTLFYLIEGKLPFPGPCTFSKVLSPKMENFILSILQKDHYLRPTAEQLWSHPLFQNFIEVVNRPKAIDSLQPLLFKNIRHKRNPTPRLTFQSVQSVPLKSTKELLIENGICLEKNIQEISEFAPNSEEEESIYDQEIQSLNAFKHICVIQNDFKDVIKIPKFEKNRTIAILIPKTVKELPRDYFHYFKNLETFHILAEIEILTYGIFHKCDKLNEVVLPENLKQIEFGSFLSCYSLSKITIPASVRIIGRSCFYNCKNLKQINLPEGLMKLEEKCFEFCESLTEINIPSSVKEIENRCFYQCYKLSQINLPIGLTKIGESCFYNCKILTEINIPASVKEIGWGCFYETKLFSDDGKIYIEENVNFPMEKIMKISCWNNKKRKFQWKYESNCILQ